MKVCDNRHIQNKAIYVVMGVTLEGQKEVLGLWVAQSERARTSCGKAAPWKSLTAAFSTALGNPATYAGFPLSTATTAAG